MREPDVRIVIVEYDPLWPTLYQEERERLADVLGSLVSSVEHIGSTSVVGLSAKPIIDILAPVDDLGPANSYIPLLERLGYTFFPVLGNADRHTFGKGSPHTHHIHIVQRGGEEHIRPIVFRDYLRAHPETAQEYAALKRALAARFHNNRQAYNAAKTDFIRRIETQARK